jgi:hypothetical protein
VSALVAILTLLLLAAVILALSAPLRRSRGRPPDREREPTAERGALESARDAKYREIRDAELDYRTGKLSRQDYEQLSASLRAEAIQILDRLAQLDEPGELPPETEQGSAPEHER